MGHTSNHLPKPSRLAYSAPCYRGQLFNDLGFMGDTECSQQILEGTYDYPPNTNMWAKKILQEAQHTFWRMTVDEIATTISTADFQQYWKRVDERSSSSFSGVNFSCPISFNALCYACSTPNRVCATRYPPCTLGNRSHCVTGEDSQQ